MWVWTRITGQLNGLLEVQPPQQGVSFFAATKLNSTRSEPITEHEEAAKATTLNPANGRASRTAAEGASGEQRAESARVGVSVSERWAGVQRSPLQCHNSVRYTHARAHTHCCKTIDLMDWSVFVWEKYTCTKMVTLVYVIQFFLFFMF